MKKYEFREWELSEQAFDVYSNSSFQFWRDGDRFFVGDNPNDKPSEVGDLADVEEFLLQFAE